jgi:hypothetical protein
MKLSMKDARLQVMRGNLSPDVVKKATPVAEDAPEPVVKEVPVAAPVTVDTSPIAQAMSQQSQMLAQVMQMLKPEPGKPAPTKWEFKITQRDTRGNIVSFTAEAK